MAHAVEDDTPVPDNTAAAASEEVQLGSTRSIDAGDMQIEPQDIKLSASEAGGDCHVDETQCSRTSGAASGAVDSGANDAAGDGGADPQELQQLLEALQARSNADSLAAQQRLLSSPAPVTSHSGDGGKSVPALDDSAALDDRHVSEMSSPQGNSDQQGLLEPSAIQQQAADADDDSSSSSGDSWSPASRGTRTPRATGASQAAGRSGTGSRRGSAADQAARLPGSSGWTPRAAPGAGAASSNALKYPTADYAGAEAARRAQQRLQGPKVRRSGSARRLAGARRQLFCAPRGVAAVRRQSRPSSGASCAPGSAVAGGTDGAGVAGDAMQRPRSGGARGRPRRWSGAAAPGVQLYGRVHAWKEGNKQRWGPRCMASCSTRCSMRVANEQPMYLLSPCDCSELLAQPHHDGNPPFQRCC